MESNPKPGSRRAGNGGFGFIEVVFAVAILAVALAGAYTMVVQCKRMLLLARDHYVATTLCLARIERARDVDYPLLVLMRENRPGTVVNQEGVPDDEGNFRRTTAVQPDPMKGITTMKVTVTIRNRKTGRFDVANKEEISNHYTEYLTAGDLN